MTKDTQQLFDAPWEVGVCEKGNPEFESVFIASKTGCLIGRDMEEETANRLVHLPELYDTLLDSVLRICSTCIGYDCSHIPLDDIGIYCRANCPVHKYTDLLKKVRDAE